MRPKLDALVIACPECGRPIGFKCQNYAGTNCAPPRRRVALANGTTEDQDIPEDQKAKPAPGLFD